MWSICEYVEREAIAHMQIWSMNLGEWGFHLLTCSWKLIWGVQTEEGQHFCIHCSILFLSIQVWPVLPSADPFPVSESNRTRLWRIASTNNNTLRGWWWVWSISVMHFEGETRYAVFNTKEKLCNRRLTHATNLLKSWPSRLCKKRWDLCNVCLSQTRFNFLCFDSISQEILHTFYMRNQPPYIYLAAYKSISAYTRLCTRKENLRLWNDDKRKQLTFLNIVLSFASILSLVTYASSLLRWDLNLREEYLECTKDDENNYCLEKESSSKRTTPSMHIEYYDPCSGRGSALRPGWLNWWLVAFSQILRRLLTLEGLIKDEE